MTTQVNPSASPRHGPPSATPSQSRALGPAGQGPAPFAALLLMADETEAPTPALPGDTALTEPGSSRTPAPDDAPPPADPTSAGLQALQGLLGWQAFQRPGSASTPSTATAVVPGAPASGRSAATASPAQAQPGQTGPSTPAFGQVPGAAATQPPPTTPSGTQPSALPSVEPDAGAATPDLTTPLAEALVPLAAESPRPAAPVPATQVLAATEAGAGTPPRAAPGSRPARGAAQAVSTVQLAAASRTGGTQDTTAAEAFALSASPSSDTEEAQNPTAPQSETGGTGQPETIKKESENSLMDMRQGLETHSESHPDALPPSTAADAATTQVADLMDELGGQLAYWSAQGSQRASLTLGEAGDSPLEVSLSLKDGTVDIAFESATPEVREALRLSAQDLLHTLLDAHGLSLGGVSVGGGQTSGEHAAHTPQNMVQAPAVREATGRTGQEPPTPAPVRRPPVLSAHKLDLFA